MILACYDVHASEDDNMAVLVEADKMAAPLKARVLVVTVVRSEAAVETASEALGKLRHESMVLLESIATTGEAIVAYCDAFFPRLVVVGLRQKRPSVVERVLLGSTSAYVVEHARCAVMVAK